MHLYWSGWPLAAFVSCIVEFTRRLNALLMKLFGGERVLPVLLLSNLGSSLVEFGESTRDCSPGDAGKEGPHLAMSGDDLAAAAAASVNDLGNSLSSSFPEEFMQN